MLLSFLSALLSLCFFVCCIRFDRFRIGVLYALTSLCLCFPVYAEDEAYTFDSDITEFTYLQNNELHLNQIENNIIQDEIENQEEISDILSEPLADISLRSVSGSNSDITFTLSRVDTDVYYFNSVLNALVDFTDFNSFGILANTSNGSVSLFGSTVPEADQSGYVTVSDDVNYIIARYYFDGSRYQSQQVPYSTLSSEPIVADNFGFLDSVSQFFSWILSSFTVLTTWILADSMAAVYAAIFLVGCAIAMLFRVLRSA